MYCVCCLHRVLALGHASGGTWTIVGEPAWQAVWVGCIVTQELVNPREGGAIINAVHGSAARIIHLLKIEGRRCCRSAGERK